MCNHGRVTSVADVLAQPSLTLAPIALTNPEAAIRWVATSELEDPTPFLEGRELLLTTGLATTTWQAAKWERYVDRLAVTEVAAIGLGLGLTYSEAPQDLIAACRKRGVNLVGIPRATSFVAVSRATADLLEATARAAAREELRWQRELTGAALQPRAPSAVLRKLAEVLRGAACLLDSDGHIELGPFGPSRGDLELSQIAAEIARIRPQGLRASATFTSANGATSVYPVGVREWPETYLALAWDRPTDRHRSAVTTAVALLSLEQERAFERRTTERRLRARALDLLLSGEQRAATIVLGALRGIDPAEIRLPSHIIAMRATGDDHALDDALAALEELARSAEPAKSKEPAILASRLGGELQVVVPTGRTNRVVELLLAETLRVGVGSAVPIAEAERSHTAAAHALGHTTQGVRLIRWDDVVADGALRLLDRHIADSFADTFLAKIESAGTDEKDLIGTLRSFLRHHGSRNLVAAELGVHRNTVRNRIVQIETAIGASLDEPTTRFSAWIALQVRAEQR